MTDVEQGKSPAKSSSPLKQKLTSFTQGLTAKAKQVANRLYKCPTKSVKNQKKVMNQTVKHPLKKRKHLRRRRIRRKKGLMMMKKKKKTKGEGKKTKVQMMTQKLLSKCEHCDKHPKEICVNMYKMCRSHTLCSIFIVN